MTSGREYPAPAGFHVVTVREPGLVEQVRGLIAEHTSSFGVSADDPLFVAEMAALPGGDYAAPEGTLLAAIDDHTGRAVGCVAVRPATQWVAGAGELRRMYVSPAARRRGVGRSLVRAAASFCRSAGYRTLRLVSLDHMEESHRLYESEGFANVEPYRPSSAPDVVYMELAL